MYKSITGSITEQEINELINQRTLAKENKEFDKADQIRDKLHKFQIVLEDQPKKTIWRKT